MIHVAIVEDEQLVREELKTYILQYGQEEKVEFQVHLFSDGADIVKYYEAKYDIILLDIEMPKLDGMKTAEKIREKDEKTVLMFITNMAKYAIRGYQVNALDFVMKPVNYYTFRLRFRRAVERVSERKDEEIILQTKDGIEKLSIRGIYYVEVQNRTLLYHTDRGVISVKGTMHQTEEMLKPYHFEKCNHWYLVNLRHVERAGKESITVAGEELEMSRRSRTAFLNALTEYMGGNV